jgi:hypothetical protein
LGFGESLDAGQSKRAFDVQFVSDGCRQPDLYRIYLLVKQARQISLRKGSFSAIEYS